MYIQNIYTNTSISCNQFNENELVALFTNKHALMRYLNVDKIQQLGICNKVNGN